MNVVLDITLEYSLLHVDKILVDAIIADLSLSDKISLLIQQKDEQKKRILLRLGYAPEFVDTL